ncbi:MAG: Gfo/Idh/MocA family oxidoreductase [Bacteroidetes bacterium]|nr:Gfo/Idh/MocA family oxidoreductase [Bacteroidota bacterium]
MKKNILLAGAGPMAVEYARVLSQLSCDVIVVGRGSASADRFRKVTGIHVNAGGITEYLNNNPLPDAAIVATGMETLCRVTKELLEKGCKKILVEKPAGINSSEIEQVSHIASAGQADVFVAYNRRFYASVQKAKEIISDDGEVKSFTFEFTERSHQIEKMEKPSGIKENWFLGNSTHVIDLAFFLGGIPSEINCYTTGELAWHRPAQFTGSGKTQSGALFSYHADWAAPGRWGVEICTAKHRLILRPLETLQVQIAGSDKTELATLEDENDKKFKPGLLKQTMSFLNGDYEKLCTIAYQEKMVKIYDRMRGVVS